MIQSTRQDRTGQDTAKIWLYQWGTGSAETVWFSPPDWSSEHFRSLRPPLRSCISRRTLTQPTNSVIMILNEKFQDGVLMLEHAQHLRVHCRTENFSNTVLRAREFSDAVEASRPRRSVRFCLYLNVRAEWSSIPESNKDWLQMCSNMIINFNYTIISD